MGVKPTVVSIKKHAELERNFASLGRRALEQQMEIGKLRNKIIELDQASRIRPELSWFAEECEKSLAYHDPVKGDSYKKKQKEPEFFGYQIVGKMQSLMAALTGHSWERKNGNIIRIAVGIANLSMMMAYNASVAKGVDVAPPA